MTRSPFLMRQSSVAALLVLAAGLAGPSAHAESTVYKCVKDGHVLYTDSNSGSCTVIDTGNAGAISAPAPASRAPAVSMRQGARPAASPVASPSNFPRVDGATQRARDDDRRAILDDELRAEEQKLAALRRDFNNGEPERQGGEKNYAKYQARVAQMRDDISRSEKNVEALRREIANMH
jgi:hypothetical protein